MRLGFSIIECMIYAFLLCLLSMLIFDWVGRGQVFLCKTQKKAQLFLDECAALDAFVADITAAPRNQNVWKKTGSAELVWLDGDVAIGWAKLDRALYRISGSHDGTQWTTMHKSLVINGLNRIEFSIDRDNNGNVTHISGVFGDSYRRVRLANRNIDEKG